MSVLPVELWTEIISYLAPSWAQKLSLVNHAMRKLVQNTRRDQYRNIFRRPPFYRFTLPVDQVAAMQYNPLVTGLVFVGDKRRYQAYDLDSEEFNLTGARDEALSAVLEARVDPKDWGFVGLRRYERTTCLFDSFMRQGNPVESRITNLANNHRLLLNPLDWDRANSYFVAGSLLITDRDTMTISHDDERSDRRYRYPHKVIVIWRDRSRRTIRGLKVSLDASLENERTYLENGVLRVPSETIVTVLPGMPVFFARHGPGCIKMLWREPDGTVEALGSWRIASNALSMVVTKCRIFLLAEVRKGTEVYSWDI